MLKSLLRLSKPNQSLHQVKYLTFHSIQFYMILILYYMCTTSFRIKTYRILFYFLWLYFYNENALFFIIGI
ncbi:hypothetical protein CN918_36460 [Priestia megaterium]|nr:hypothetical protein COI68_29075 [Priestia megaterium]PGK49799.1 hypothetical protein CN918_36460 [Priestia megaterium]PGZ79443.1 hypothetical protein COE55_10165 [Priestia megaterium]